MSSQSQRSKLGTGRKVLLSFAMQLITGVLIFATGEMAVLVFSPVEYLYPRYKFSPQYGLALFENRRMEHSVPGKYKYFYTINEMGYRGEAVALAKEYRRNNIIVLGDSYAFGMGVDDGDEFPQQLRRHVGNAYDVINLGNPGWGLTQQIRRYYDFGSLYHPKYVVLQFCANDPEDNFNNMVTRVENGDFAFHDAGGGISWSKKYLSNSILQKSQLYNFFRGRAYIVIKNILVKRKQEQYVEQSREAAGQTNPDIGRSPKEAFYNELLNLFAKRLADEGVRLVVIAVNKQLEIYPGIRDNVLSLDRAGVLDYVEVLPWFDGASDYSSPDGHLWGQKGHDIVARGLAKTIRELAGTHVQTAQFLDDSLHPPRRHPLQLHLDDR